MTRSGRNLNIRLLRSFLNDVVEGIFGDTYIEPVTAERFFTFATDSHLLRLRGFMDAFTSNLESNPDPGKRASLKAFVESVVS